MVVLASSGTKLTVRSRTPHMEGAAITRGETYEANYDVSGQMSQRQAIEFIRAVRRRSLDYADVVLFQYADVKESSPQTVTYQFKALKSTRSPFLVTAAVILTGIVLAAAAVTIIGPALLALRSLDTVLTGVVAPFTPKLVTTYVDPETGDEYGTYEEYAFAYSQRHPGATIPEPAIVETTEALWTTTAIGLALIVGLGLLLLFLWMKYGEKVVGGVKRAGGI